MTFSVGRRPLALALALCALSPALHAQFVDPCNRSSPVDPLGPSPSRPAGTAPIGAPTDQPSATPSPTFSPRPSNAPPPDGMPKEKPEVPLSGLLPATMPAALFAAAYAAPAAAQVIDPCAHPNLPPGALIAPPVAQGRPATDAGVPLDLPPPGSSGAPGSAGPGASLSNGPASPTSVDASRLRAPDRASSEASGVLSAAGNDLAIGDGTAARLRLDRWLAQHPDDAAALILRAEASNRLRDYESARGDAARAARLQPGSSRAWEQLAYADHRLGNADEASRAAQMAVRLGPANATAQYVRYLTSGKAGELTTAFAALGQAARLDPKDYAPLASRVQAEGRFIDPAGDGGLGAEARLLPRGGRAVALWLGAALALGLLLLGLWALSRRGKRPVTFTRLAAPRRVAKYELGALLGRGGMGEVYRGFDVDLRRPVAIKRLLDGLDATDKRRQMLLSEARSVAAVHHPAVVEIYDILQEGRDLYMVFELVDGKTVSEILEGKSFAPAEALALLEPVFEALQLAHDKGIVHRDIKPGNLMLEKSGRLKLMDFGIAKALPAAAGPGPNFAQTMSIAGSPYYMAPEAEQGLVTAAGDVYALAICAYQMMTGRLPFPLMSRRAPADYIPVGHWRPELPASLDGALLQALSPDPKARPASVKAFAALLQRCLPA